MVYLDLYFTEKLNFKGNTAQSRQAGFVRCCLND